MLESPTTAGNLKLIRFHMTLEQWRRQGGAWGGTCPPKNLLCPPNEISFVHQKASKNIFKI